MVSNLRAPVLIIQYLDGDKAMVKVSPCAFPTSGACTFKGTNGLSTPRLVDLDGNGTVDVAYAGDLLGNVWKFNLTSATASSWSTSFSNQPFFVAKQGGLTQPITAAPFWKPHPLGGVMVAVATGRNLTDADQSTTQTDSVYGIYDNSTFTVTVGVVTLTDTTPINTTASSGLPTTMVSQPITLAATVDGGTNYFVNADNPVDYVGKPNASPAVPADRGWYMNYVISGQRVIKNIQAFSGQKIRVSSEIPKTGGNSNVETCSPSPTAERTFQSVLNLFTGGVSGTATFTFSKDPFTGLPNVPVSVGKSIGTIEGVAGDTTTINTDTGAKLLSSNCKTGTVCNAVDLNTGSYLGKRVGWRVVR